MSESKVACRYHETEEGGGVHQPTCGECIESHNTGVPQPVDDTASDGSGSDGSESDAPSSSDEEAPASRRRKRK